LTWIASTSGQTRRNQICLATRVAKQIFKTRAKSGFLNVRNLMDTTDTKSQRFFRVDLFYEVANSNKSPRKMKKDAILWNASFFGN